MRALTSFCQCCKSALRPEPPEVSFRLGGVLFTVSRGCCCSNCAQDQFEKQFKNSPGLVTLTGNGLIINWKKFRQDSSSDLIVLRAAGLLYHAKEPPKNPRILNTAGQALALEEGDLYFARDLDAYAYQRAYRKKSS